jgi:hypothetical protein
MMNGRASRLASYLNSLHSSRFPPSLLAKVVRTRQLPGSYVPAYHTEFCRTEAQENTETKKEQIALTVSNSCLAYPRNFLTNSHS